MSRPWAVIGRLAFGFGLVCAWLLLAPIVWDGAADIIAMDGGGPFLLSYVGVVYIVAKTAVGLTRRRGPQVAVDPLRSEDHARWPKEGPERRADQRRRASHEAAHATAAWALGAEVTAVHILTRGSTGGVCVHEDVPDLATVDQAWVNLVVAMAGQQADLAAGHRDQSSTADVRAALEQAAVILSTGQRPQHVTGTLTSDQLFAQGCTWAKALLEEHKEIHRQITDQLLAHPNQVLTPTLPAAPSELSRALMAASTP